ncbi:Tn3 family transposase [Streptomyces sp. NPDC004752]
MPAPLLPLRDNVSIGHTQGGQLINCTASEVAAIVEGTMRHGTTMDVEANYTDNHGQSEIGFGITPLIRLIGGSRSKFSSCTYGRIWAGPRARSTRTPAGWPSTCTYASEWHTIGRLLRPLDDARAAMRCPDTPHHRRAITDTIGLILLRAAELETAYWAWTPQEWLRLIGTTVDEFEKPWPGWIDVTVRPYLVADGYLLCGFTDFDRVGPFNRLALTWRVFGREPVDHSIQ